MGGDDWLAALPPVPDISEAQIAAAMERAVEIARQPAHDPDRVEAHPFRPAEAVDWPRRLRHADWFDVRRGLRREAPENWCFVGWVKEPGALGAWRVWWCPETERVWLRAEGAPWRWERSFPDEWAGQTRLADGEELPGV